MRLPLFDTALLSGTWHSANLCCVGPDVLAQAEPLARGLTNRRTWTVDLSLFHCPWPQSTGVALEGQPEHSCHSTLSLLCCPCLQVLGLGLGKQGRSQAECTCPGGNTPSHNQSRTPQVPAVASLPSGVTPQLHWACMLSAGTCCSWGDIPSQDQLRISQALVVAGTALSVCQCQLRCTALQLGACVRWVYCALSSSMCSIPGIALLGSPNYGRFSKAAQQMLQHPETVPRS